MRKPRGATSGFDSAPGRDVEATGDGEFLVRRLPLLAAMIVVFFAIAAVAEGFRYPERAAMLRIATVVCIVACAGAIVLSRRRPDRAVLLGAALIAALTLFSSGSFAFYPNPPDRLAMAQVCVIYGSVVLFPVGWRAQTLVALVAFAGTALALWGAAVPASDVFYPLLGVAVGATGSVGGAMVLERHRREAQEEGAIHKALVRVGEAFDAHLGAPDMLEQVNRLAPGLLGCDVSLCFFFDDVRRSFRLQASAGLSDDLRTELRQVEFPWESIPLFRALRPGELIELADPSRQSLVPTSLMARFEVASALVVPFTRGTEIAGLLVAARREHVGPFSRFQRSLALGIARITAAALENARLIEKLQAASALKSEFVATMSHELRTPLNVIIGYTDLIVDGALGELEPPQLAALTKVRRNARQLFVLIEETLDIGRLESGRVSVDLAPTDLDEMVSELGTELEGLAAPGVALHLRCEAEPVVVDRLKLKTILKNLLGNALKFTTSGSVELSIREADGRLRLEVADTGIGMSEEDIPHIFEMFRQIDGSAARGFEGVGLGLHIVARLVSLLGGSIDVRSLPGAGSTFTVEVPAMPFSREAAEIRGAGFARNPQPT